MRRVRSLGPYLSTTGNVICVTTLFPVLGSHIASPTFLPKEPCLKPKGQEKGRQTYITTRVSTWLSTLPEPQLENGQTSLKPKSSCVSANISSVNFLCSPLAKLPVTIVVDMRKCPLNARPLWEYTLISRHTLQ